MPARRDTRLVSELEMYIRHKDEWLRGHPGEYVVIKGDQVLDFFPTFERAYSAGAGTWGMDTDFLVKCIVEQEPVFFIF